MPPASLQSAAPRFRHRCSATSLSTSPTRLGRKLQFASQPPICQRIRNYVTRFWPCAASLADSSALNMDPSGRYSDGYVVSGTVSPWPILPQAPVRQARPWLESLRCRCIGTRCISYRLRRHQLQPDSSHLCSVAFSRNRELKQCFEA